VRTHQATPEIELQATRQTANQKTSCGRTKRVAHLQLYELAESAGIIIPARLGVTKSLQQRVGLKNLPNCAILLHFCHLDLVVLPIVTIKVISQFVALLLRKVNTPVLAFSISFEYAPDP
jgi:hypothetical protein